MEGETRKVYQVHVVLIEVEQGPHDIVDVDFLLEDEVKGAPVAGDFETKEEALAFYNSIAAGGN